MYAEQLNFGSDLLTGTGLSKYVILRRMIAKAEEVARHPFDFVLIDLPPSFGALVRAALYSANYFIVPCTSDNFSVYCLGLIGQMVPAFIRDWGTGLDRFRQANRHYTDFDTLGKPAFAGWIFNGFDTTRERRTTAEIEAGVAVKEKKMVQADQTLHDRIVRAIVDDLVEPLRVGVGPHSVAGNLPSDFRVGDVEDANVLVQNSLWQNVPVGQLHTVQQVKSLQDRRAWADNQIEQIELFRTKFDACAEQIETVCV